MQETAVKEIILRGVSGSPGICIGKAYLVDSGGVDVIERYYVKKNQIQSEENRFKAAVKKARNELKEIIEDSAQDSHRNNDILETHLVLLKDKMLYGKILETVKKEQINTEWAIKKVVTDVKSMFKNMSDSYLKERAADIVHVSNRVMRHLVGSKSTNIAEIDKRVILVAHDLSPAETSQIQLERIMGFITDLGGSASHTGIIARTLEIPAVLGVDKATELVDNGDIIVVDGAAGLVILNPTEHTLLQFYERKNRYEDYQAAITRKSHLSAVTTDGYHLQVMGNIELPEEVASMLAHGGDGIGLYRTEYQYLNRFNFPSESELFDQYKEVVEIVAPQPVTIRTLDINGDIAVAYASDIDEPNPALGLRAIRYCLQRPDIFKTQLRAILRAAVFGHVRILFPMIATYDEILGAKRILQEAADSLESEGAVFRKDLEIGIMIEVPSAVVMADVMADAVDFFSIGTNDLIQYAFAMDRGNKQVAYLYNPLHPAVIRMVKHVADVAKGKGIKIYMCGEMAGDPINIPLLLGLGIDELSMNPMSIPIVKSLIRSLSVEDTRLFVKKVLKLKTTAEVLELVQGTFGSIISDKTYTE